MAPSRGLFVPPNPICPSLQTGRQINLLDEPFGLYVAKHDIFFSIWIAFGNPNSSHIESSEIAAELNSKLAKKAQHIVTTSRSRLIDLDKLSIVRPHESDVVAQMRELFLARIRSCHGVVHNKCWALDQNAMQKVFEAV